MFQSKGNTGKTSKKHSEDDKNLDAEGDEDWGCISHMHKRYFEDLVDVLLFSNAKLTFYLRAVVLSFLFCLMQRSRIGKTFYAVAPCLFCALPSVLYHFIVFFFFWEISFHCLILWFLAQLFLCGILHFVFIATYLKNSIKYSHVSRWNLNPIRLLLHLLLREQS